MIGYNRYIGASQNCRLEKAAILPAKEMVIHYHLNT